MYFRIPPLLNSAKLCVSIALCLSRPPIFAAFRSRHGYLKAHVQQQSKEMTAEDFRSSKEIEIRHEASVFGRAKPAKERRKGSKGQHVVYGGPCLKMT